MRRNTSLDKEWSFTSKNWRKPPAKLGFSSHEPRVASVPGLVHLDLMREGIIADPFERCQEIGCQWVDDEDWVYEGSFQFDPDAALPRRILHFEGLDTVCQVYLNDHLIAEHDNQFLPLDVDVTDALAVGKNRLRVEFQSASRIGQERRAKYFREHQIAEDTVRMDARAFVRKAQYMFGWDWGPSLISAGIYRPVSLIEHAGRLLDVHVEQRHLPSGTVEVKFTSRVELVPGASGLTVYHFLEGQPEPLEDGRWYPIAEPRLWWPNGMGSPELYTLDSGLFACTPRSRQALSSAVDTSVKRVGFRTIEVRCDRDEWGTSFRFVVNGRECYALGANYIPDDNFVPRVDRARLGAQLERALDLGMNMLRVWGGGFYETDEFYDLCDEMGLLVWQDFPYACSYYPDDEAACSEARKEARYHIVRLRNHPSLALWCGNNENQTMRESGWEGRERQPARYEGERIYDGVLPELLAELDPTRRYIPTSPFGEGQANCDGNGDQHFWEVWHGKGDWKHYTESEARFCSEFGFASAPGHATWMSMDRNRSLLDADVRDPVARWHDKTAKGYDTFLSFVELHYPKSTTIEEWTYFSQLNQRDALRCGIEHFRRSPRCRGTLVWQLNDCWPVQSWAVVDSSFHYKAAAFEMRRLYASRLISLVQTESSLEVWGILDNVAEEATEEVTLELLRLRADAEAGARVGIGVGAGPEAEVGTGPGTTVRAQSSRVTLVPGDRKRLFECSLEGLPLEAIIAKVTVGASVSYRLLAEPKDVTLVAHPLEVTVHSDCITVTTAGPVVDLCLWDAASGAHFLDNFVTLATAGSISVRYRGTLTQIFARSLGGRHEVTVSP